jgi:hypothetical protein
LNGWDFPFVNSVKYFGVIVNTEITRRLHKETIPTNAFRTFNRLYCLFRSERLSANIKLILDNPLIMSVMTCVHPAWEFAAETCSAWKAGFSVPMAIFQGSHCHDMQVAFPNALCI